MLRADVGEAVDQMWRAIEFILRNMDPVFEPSLDDVLAGLRTLTVELLKAGKDVIQIKDVPGQPGVKQAVLVPVNATQQEIVKAARSAYRGLRPDLRTAAKQRAGEVFEEGSIQYSLFLALLALSDP